MTTAISETVSKKRGRPSVFDPAWVKIVASMWPDLRSKRQVVAKCYEVEALRIVKDADGVDAIFDKAATYHATIMERLGRIAKDGIVTDAEVVAAAVWISDRLKSDPTFTVRQAVALLRLFREEVVMRMILGFEGYPADKLLPLLHADIAEGGTR